MVEIQSKEVIDKISDELKIQPSLTIPRVISKDIQLTYEVNPMNVVNAFAQASSTVTGVTTVFTVPTDRDFYLTTANLTLSANATSDGTSGFMFITPEGSGGTASLLMTKETLTAFSDNISADYSRAIKLQRGSSITINHTFSTGSQFISGFAGGYTTDPL